jgi:hypothetical protein
LDEELSDLCSCRFVKEKLTAQIVDEHDWMMDCPGHARKLVRGID